MAWDGKGSVTGGFVTGETTVSPSGAGLAFTTILDDATGDETAYELDYTVNKATSGNATGLKINMTDTANPGTSNLIDAQVGGVSKFAVDISGAVTIPGSILLNGYIFTPLGQMGMVMLTNGNPGLNSGLSQVQNYSGIIPVSDVVVIDASTSNMARRAITTDTTTAVFGSMNVYGGTNMAGHSIVNCGPAAVAIGDRLVVSTEADGCAMTNNANTDFMLFVGVALSAKAVQDNAAYVSHDAGTDIVTVNGTADTWAANQRIVLMGGTFGGLTQGAAYYVISPTGAPTTAFQLSLTSGGAAIDLTAAAASGSPTFEPTATCSVWLK